MVHFEHFFYFVHRVYKISENSYHRTLELGTGLSVHFGVKNLVGSGADCDCNNATSERSKCSRAERAEQSSIKVF